MLNKQGDVLITAKDNHFSEITKEILSRGHNLRFRALGVSMRPFIKNGEIIIVQPLPASKLRVGDIVFFKTDDRGLVAHRLISVKADGLLVTKGDATYGFDREIKADKVLGKVIAVEKKSGRTVLLNRWHNQVIGWLISKLLAVNLSFYHLYQLIRKLIVVPLRPILTALQGLKIYRLITKKFGGDIHYGLAQPEDEILLSYLLDYAGNPQLVSLMKSANCRLENRNEDWLQMVAKKKDKIVGAVTARKHDSNESFLGGWWLWALVVRLRYRGCGIGENLVKQILAAIKERGGEKVMLTVDKSAKPALNLYRKLGFVELDKNGLQLPSWRQGRSEQETLLIYHFKFSNQRSPKPSQRGE